MTLRELWAIYHPVVAIFSSIVIEIVATANESMLLAVLGAAAFFIGVFQTMTVLSTGGVDWR